MREAHLGILPAPSGREIVKGLGEFPPNFRKVGAGGRAQRVGRGLSQGSLRPLVPWGEVGGGAPAQPPLSS